MKVLLVQPKYTYSEDVPLIIEMPLGLCYLAAVLRERGHKVKIIDCLAEGYLNKERNNKLITYGISDDEIIKRVKEFDPDVVGCSALFTIQYGNVKKLCRLIKEINPNIVTVVGGMHVTIKPYEALSNKDVDFVLQGEADYFFENLNEAVNFIVKGQGGEKK